MKKCKKLLLFSGLFFLAGLFGVFFPGGSAHAGYLSGIGQSEDYKRQIGWIDVYNNDNSDRTAGEVLCYSSGSAMTGIEVSTCDAYANPLVAGVVPYGTTLYARKHGWLQTTGYHPAVVIASSTVMGDPLVSSVTEGDAAVYEVGQGTFTTATHPSSGVIYSTSAALQYGVFGYALDTVSSASSSTVKAMLRTR